MHLFDGDEKIIKQMEFFLQKEDPVGYMRISSLKPKSSSDFDDYGMSGDTFIKMLMSFIAMGIAMIAGMALVQFSVMGYVIVVASFLLCFFYDVKIMGAANEMNSKSPTLLEKE